MHATGRYGDARLSNVRLTPEHAEKLAKWLKEAKNFFVFLGNPGIGKTYTCAAIYYYMKPKVNSIRYYSERDLLQRIRSHIDSGTGGDYLNQLHYLVDDEFLILDDLGSSGVNEWRKEVLFEFIDYRYNLKKPTVITSNLSLKEIKESFGDRSYSRVAAKENLIIEAGYYDLRQEGL